MRHASSIARTLIASRTALRAHAPSRADIPTALVQIDRLFLEATIVRAEVTGAKDTFQALFEFPGKQSIPNTNSAHPSNVSKSKMHPGSEQPCRPEIETAVSK